VVGRLQRVLIEHVTPQVDGGRFPAKRVTGELVEVEADVFADGHDLVAAAVRYRAPGSRRWRETLMAPAENDRVRGEFRVDELGCHEYTVAGWVDAFGTWRRDLAKKMDAGQNVTVDLLVGAELAADASRRAKGADQARLLEWADRLESDEPDAAAALSDDLALLAARYPDRSGETVYDRTLRVWTAPPGARFSTWYEFFPRSFGGLKASERILGYVARMGFDVVYLPPVHPIGVTNRKGRNNTVECAPADPGSPWAIGSQDGGHTAIDPALGTLEDFDGFVARARECGLEVAMDIAFQCSPDHPWVKEHPEWFVHRPDGTIAYAENPPKRYEDIYPLDFTNREVWEEARAVVEFWMDRGVRVFRVDNPHTKPFAFWDWLLGGIHERRPDVVFLAEAFTRPKVMYRLAKTGFDQSVTYFTWRTVKWELTEYFTELTREPVVDFYRANLWPNTPDILPFHLQHRGPQTFMARLVLAATLGASYGIYGPAFELGENAPLAESREEYLDSEKYEVRQWDLGDPASLAEFIALVNRIRRENSALHADRTLRFHEVQNDNLIAYSKCSQDRSNVILVVVNLDPEHTQSAMLHVPTADFGIEATYPVHDLLTDARYTWHGDWNYVELRADSAPAHVLRLRHHVPGEADFEQF
jgi:starch synthase (maltosyl-transferring)